MKRNVKDYLTIGVVLFAVVFVLPALTDDNSQPASVTGAAKQNKKIGKAVEDGFLSVMDLTDKLMSFFDLR